jgi:hypothetical protein
MSDLEEEIKSQGYWWIVIHPATYIPKRVELSDLETVLRRARIQLRGWDFPHIDERSPIKYRLKSITGSTDWMYYRELWRFYESGQFSYLIGIHEDWVDRTTATNFGPGWGPPAALTAKGPLLGVGDALFRITEAFEFASKLAVTPAGGDKMHIKIEVHGLRGRMLWVDSQNRFPMDHEYRADINAFPFEDDYTATELASRGRELSAEVARQFFVRFGWRPPTETLRQQQNELRATG